MKEICGYKGKDGQFYESEKECKKADLTFEIQNEENELRNFVIFVEGEIRRRYPYTDVYKILSEFILKDSEMFMEIISRKKEIEQTLKQLRKEYNHIPYWWDKFKWW